MRFFDENDTPCATLNVLNNAPVLELMGNKGSVSIAFDEDGLPHLKLKDERYDHIGQLYKNNINTGKIVGD